MCVQSAQHLRSFSDRQTTRGRSRRLNSAQNERSRRPWRIRVTREIQKGKNKRRRAPSPPACLYSVSPFRCLLASSIKIYLNMADPSYYSPSFKKPCDVLRMRRKRARSEVVSRGAAAASRGSEAADLRPFCPGPLLSTHTGARGGVKRRNPFANIENTSYNSPKKRSCSENSMQCKEPCSALCEGENPPERLRANALPSLRETGTKVPHSVWLN